MGNRARCPIRSICCACPKCWIFPSRIFCRAEIVRTLRICRKFRRRKKRKAEPKSAQAMRPKCGSKARKRKIRAASNAADRETAKRNPPRRKRMRGRRAFAKYCKKRAAIPTALQARCGIGSGCNGYSSGERIFGYMLFAVFTVVAVIMLAVQLAGWVSRPRELTMENYGDFVEIDIVAAESFNPDEYIVRVTAKEVMTNLRITVRVTFWSFRGNEFSETVTVAAAVLSEGGTAEEPIHISEIALDRGFEVLSVEGDLE